MSRIVDTTQYLDTALSLLQNGQVHIPVPVSGTSMCPFLHPGDTVYLEPVPKALHPGDIVLFRRRSGQYILHRIIKKASGSTVLIAGDNQTALEPVDAATQIVAYVSSATRKGRSITVQSPTWLFYSILWRWLRPLRPAFGIFIKWNKTR